MGAGVRHAGTGRERWADDLRVLVIAGVIVLHTSSAYLGGSADWFYMHRTQSTVWSTAVGFPVALGGIFGLAPLFLLAGWFAAGSLAHRGAGPYAVDRLLRLGVPFVVYVTIVDPLAAYVGGVAQGTPKDLGSYLLPHRADAGPMWFVAALLAISLGYAVTSVARARVSPPRAGRAAWPAGVVLALAAGVLMVVSSVVWRWWPLDDNATPLNLRLGLWPQGAVLFALGAWLAHDGRLDAIGWDRTRRLGWAALTGVVALCLVAAWLLVDLGTTSSAASPAWTGVVLSVIHAVVSVTWPVWFVAWLRRRRPRRAQPGRLRLAAARGSYATYVLHPLVLTAVMAAFVPLELAPEPAFLVVSVVGVVVCFAVGWLVTRLPGVRRVV